MNMPTFKRLIPVLLVGLAMGSCTEEKYTYGVNDVIVQPTDLSGKKSKSTDQKTTKSSASAKATGGSGAANAMARRRARALEDE